MILAVQQYMCFLKFSIPDAYVAHLLQTAAHHLLRPPGNEAAEEDMDVLQQQYSQNIISLHITTWFNLGLDDGRKAACQNIREIVLWQRSIHKR